MEEDLRATDDALGALREKATVPQTLAWKKQSARILLEIFMAVTF
jgi:hypothetical protein